MRMEERLKKILKGLPLIVISLIVVWATFHWASIRLNDLQPLDHRLVRGGSPLGRWISRLVYWRTQTDWHYGVSPKNAKINGRTRIFLPIGPSGMPPWAEWLDALSRSLCPSAAIVHQREGEFHERSKNSVVLLLMRWALRLDPSYTRVYREKAFIEDRRENSPKLAEETLMIGLSEVGETSEQIELLVDLIFLRYYRLQDPVSARELIPILEKRVLQCQGMLSAESQLSVRACLFLGQHSRYREK